MFVVCVNCISTFVFSNLFRFLFLRVVYHVFSYSFMALRFEKCEMIKKYSLPEIVLQVCFTDFITKKVHGKYATKKFIINDYSLMSSNQAKNTSTRMSFH